MNAKRGTEEHTAMRLAMTLHNPPSHPHWSEGIEWRHDRWDPLCNAPVGGYPIMHVRGRTADGRIVEPMHFACDLSGEEQPPFRGWFVPDGGGSSGFHEVSPVEWQPLRATYESVRLDDD